MSYGWGWCGTYPFSEGWTRLLPETITPVKTPKPKERDMSKEVWHIADEDGNPICGAVDEDAWTLSDPENIEDAERRGILCHDCE